MTTHRLLNHLKIEYLPGIGEKSAKKMHQIGIFTLRDLLLHLPIRYEDHSKISLISKVALNENTNVIGQILNTEIISTRKRKMLICKIKDETGVMILRFMNFYPSLMTKLTQGKWIKAFGHIISGKICYEIIHPEITIANNHAELIKQDDYYQAIYSTTSGITQSFIKKNIDLALNILEKEKPPEILPDEYSANFKDIVTTLRTIHQPTLQENISSLENNSHIAKKRLIFEELLSYLISIKITKTYDKKLQSTAINPTFKLINYFLNLLPYSPTHAQNRVINEIWHDMSKKKPMMRLVQGDVGSGKTLIATLAALNAIENNFQVVFMAPTEVLAEQHYQNLKDYFKKLKINIALLTGNLTLKQKSIQHELASSGDVKLLIGTHAVFSEKVTFNKLGLIIIDEQHRFGVNQRFTLWNKGLHDNKYPHQLMMTATPIPRTLAMTLYADLSISTIDELPPGRTPIKTIAIPNLKRDEVIERIKENCKRGTQVYWVCTLIEESELLNAQAAQETFNLLQSQLPELNISLIHGKLKSSEKQQIMLDFKENKIQLLVATTVIEVGVDVPNATLMIIENAERLGLSQLHQLRGRVGRGKAESFCVLLYQSPLGKISKSRIDVMRNNNDGFVIAEKDLELRGSGDFLGTNQIGTINFKIADFKRDLALLEKIDHIATRILLKNPTIAKNIADDWLADKAHFIHA